MDEELLTRAICVAGLVLVTIVAIGQAPGWALVCAFVIYVAVVLLYEAYQWIGDWCWRIRRQIQRWRC
jgi:uncharacterized membrane protein